MKMYYITILSNLKEGYDKYSGSFYKFSKSKFKNKFFLLYQNQLDVGIKKNKALLIKNNNPKDKIIIIQTTTKLPLKNDHSSGIAQYIDASSIKIENLYIDNLSNKISIEEAMALSFSINIQELYSYQELTPRSFSFLPVAKGCQAKCSFCFSKASISNDFSGKSSELAQLENSCQIAKSRGAIRGVITGGGEPTLLDHKTLLQAISIMAKHFNKVVMITNGYIYANMSETDRIKNLRELAGAGLSIINISRHHHNIETNKKIMGLNIPSENIINSIHKENIPLEFRLTCVLQKQGISSSQDIQEYIDFANSLQITQICFKELYVSTSTESYYHNNQANHYSRINQVPLEKLTETLNSLQFTETDTLPWGSKIYKKDKLQIAAYTEPSVFWERKNKIARSWNLLSNGNIYVSLEDVNSELSGI